ncbi:MAG TPA: DUF3365 domain-containing protein [Acidobacteriota bacterium]|nr:DUF3365 domain-containing protein [Acidobacteriota bacterium]
MRRLAIYVLIIVALIVAVNFFYNLYSRHKEEEALVYQQARAIAGLVEAMQEFMARNQELINRSPDGHIEFKGLNPEKFSREVSALFNQSTDHRLRLISLHPRVPSNLPDAIERPILEEMARNLGMRERFSPLASERTYLYVKRLDIRSSCLTCHGGPAGSTDITGYRREGMVIGDLGGAISVRIPAAGLMESNRQRAWMQLLFALLLMGGAVVLIVHLLLRMTRLSGELSEANLNLEVQHARSTLLEKQKDDLFHMLIHDMKAPLSFMIGSLQMLQEQKVGSLNEEQEELAALVLRGCRRLETIISNLLDINRMEEGRLELKNSDVPLLPMIEDRSQPWLQLAKRQRKQFAVRVNTKHPVLRCDRLLLERILENLISNAFKHTRDGDGEIVLELTDWFEPEGVQFRLSDNGEGIPPEFIDRIFEKYSVVEGQELGQKSDTGLGLAFCHLAVQTMGGHIRAESSPGQRTVFTFFLPLKPPVT